MALLEIENLTVEFKTGHGWFRAVDSVSMTVDQGEVLAIVGESGSGKSVAMLAVMGLLPWTAKVTADRLQFDGRPLLKMPRKERREAAAERVVIVSHWSWPGASPGPSPSLWDTTASTC